MENVRFDILCPRCKNTICIECFSKLNKCPLCRYQYGSNLPSKWDMMIDRLNLSMKRLYDLGLVR